MFWAKWIGKLSGIAGSPENVEITVHKTEWVSLLLMAAIAVIACVLLPLVSTNFVEPYIVGVLGKTAQGVSTDNLWITSILAVIVVVFLFGGLRSNSKQKRVDVYLAGVNSENDRRMFRNSLTGETEATSRNMYLDGIFGEAKLRPLGEMVCTVVIVMALIAATIVSVM